MKKLFLIILFFIISFSCVSAQEKLFNYSPDDPEKIYLFDANIFVEENGEIQVTETIALNVKHQKINHGLIRNIPVSEKEKLHNISLFMDGVKHPFFTEKAGSDLEIYFGDDNYISTGLHIYTLTYKYNGAINSLRNYDELYWDVTGNEWSFPIDKAKVKVIFSGNTNIMENGISLYTGKYGEKEHNAKQIDTLTFETTAPLKPGEGFTIAIPFHKGTIEPVEKPFAYSPSDPEKIYLFDVNIIVEKNGEIEVSENITLNAKHQEINRGIIRNIPVSAKEKLHNISLTMDGVKHPFFTEKAGPDLEINFGDDNYISTGLHTYRLTYKFMGAINFNKNFDELYWDVTGNEWSFPIDKARIKVLLPGNTNIIENGISLYTGKEGEKEHNAKQIDTLTFETTAPLSPGEGFTIAIPFDKGAIIQPPFLKRISLSVYISVVIFVLFILYCVITWIKVGIDPTYTIVPQYDLPKDISPALVYYESIYRDNSNAGPNKRNYALSCAILNLAMKKYIQIKEENGIITLSRQKNETQDLPREEQIIMEDLFKDKPEHILHREIDPSCGEKLEKISSEISSYLSRRMLGYRKHHDTYKLFAFLFVLALGIIPFIFDGSGMFVVNMFIIIFLFPILGCCSLLLRFCAFLIITAIIIFGTPFSETVFCETLFLLSMFAILYYSYLIPNVTPAGKEFYALLKGFKKYMKTAEWQRAQASNPLDTERIFCDFLPYAFAMGIHNQWIKKFTGILSEATISEYIERLGGTYTITRGLRENIRDSMPIHYSSGSSGGGHSHSSGSFGGGSSGGGHGGGGGRGR